MLSKMHPLPEIIGTKTETLYGLIFQKADAIIYTYSNFYNKIRKKKNNSWKFSSYNLCNQEDTT